VTGRRDEIGITDAELRAATRQLDEMHRATFPAVREWYTGVAETSRRGLLAAGVALGSVLAACSSGGSSPASPYVDDLRIVAMVTALENLAVAAYTHALRAAAAGTYGAVPPAFTAFATVVRGQHAEHAQAWNATLDSVRLPRVTGTPLTIAPALTSRVTATRGVMQVAEIALDLEKTAAATYAMAVADGQYADGIAIAATIAPVEAQHAAVLAFILGQDPVPAPYLATTGAVTTTQLTA
jgi:Ferritin-like domain